MEQDMKQQKDNSANVLTLQNIEVIILMGALAYAIYRLITGAL